MIWHIDTTAGGNSNEGYPGQSGWPENGNHYKVAVLQADGDYDLEHGYNRGDGGDVYHASGVSSIGPGPGIYPSTDSYQGGTILQTFVTIDSIANAGGDIMQFAYGDSCVPSPTNPPTDPPAAGNCKSWCAGNTQPWSAKCTWAGCSGCSECDDPIADPPTDPPVGNCASWCVGNSQPWTSKCTWVNCSGCSDCDTGICKSWCAGNTQPWTSKCTWVNCAGCSECLPV